MTSVNEAKNGTPSLAVLTTIMIAFFAGFIVGLGAASYQTKRWLLENKLAEYDSKTGKLIITLPGSKNDGQPIQTHGPL
jgi:alpha-D-ribose 1-methylphosphonate 5-triphosphate synthase subunit PhnL